MSTPAAIVSTSLGGIGLSFTPIIAFRSIIGPCILHLANSDLTNNLLGEVAFSWGNGDISIWAQSLTELAGPDGTGIPPGGDVYLDIPDRRPLQLRIRGKASAGTVIALAELWPADWILTVKKVRMQ